MQTKTKTSEMTVLLPSPAVDNHGGRYAVTIESGDPQFGPVLVVQNTSGRWYLRTLMDGGKPRQRIPLDFGQGWILENFDVTMAEALAAMVAHPWILQALAEASE